MKYIRHHKIIPNQTTNMHVHSHQVCKTVHMSSHVKHTCKHIWDFNGLLFTQGANAPQVGGSQATIKRPHCLDPHPTRPGLSFRFNLRRLCLGLLFKYLCLNTTRLNKPNPTRRIVTTPVPRNIWGQLRFANKAHTCLVKREQCWCTVILLTHRSAGPITVKGTGKPGKHFAR